MLSVHEVSFQPATADMLPATGVGLAHLVGVEVQARSNVNIRKSISEREDALEQTIAGDANASAGSIRQSFSAMRKSFAGRPSGAESSRNLSEVLVGSESSSRSTQSQIRKSLAPPQDPDRAKNELTLLKAAKKVADIEAHKYSLSDVESILRTNLSKGLTSADASARLLRDGPNMLTPPKQTPWWVKLLKQLVGGFQLMLVGAAILCWIVANLSDPVDSQTNFLGYVLVAVVVFTGVFAFFQEAKSDKVMEGFKALTPSRCHVIRDGAVIECAAGDLVIGDVVEVQFGEKVPADLRIIQTANLKVDNSSLTGEAEPLSRSVDCTHDNPMETKNIAFYGTFFTEGSGRGVVFQTGDRTFLGTIASAAIGAKQPESTLQRELHYFVKTMTIMAIAQGLVFFLIAVYQIKYPLLEALIFAIGLITANVPEGLLPQLTIILTLCARRMKDINVLVKTLDIMETLGCTTCIASDKTGTLTQNKMTVSHVYYGGKIYNSGGNAVSGAHYSAFDKSNLNFSLLQRCATVCNRAVFVVQDGEKPDMTNIQNWKVHGDASESALIKFCHPLSDIVQYRERFKCVASVPFNSTNKWQLSIHTTDDPSQPHILLIKGAPERILKMCSHARIDSELCPIDPAAVEAANFELGSRGERVLAFAELPLDPAAYPLGFSFNTDKINFPISNLHFCGLISLIDPPREGVAEAVLVCIKAGIKVVMVTGDHPVTARAIARSVNIMPGETIEELAAKTGQDVSTIDRESVDCIVVPGHLLPTYSEEDWEYTLSRKQIVFARTMPQQKQDIVAHLQTMGHIVAVTGDGVNDSPALKQADVGVAMGIMGSDVAKEAAKVILMDDNFASIVHGIAEGRLIFDNLKKCIIYVLVHITPEMVPFLLFVVLQIPLALQVVMILTIDLGTDLVPAIALAYEEMEGVIMEKPPRNAVTDRLAGLQLWAMGYFWLGGIETGLCFFTFLSIFWEFGFTPSSLYGSAVGFANNLAPFTAADLIGKRFGNCASSCNPSLWIPSQPDTLCLLQSCTAACERLRFFCNMAANNQKWQAAQAAYVAQGKNFGNWRVEALVAAQSGYLFTIMLGQIATMMCVKTRFQSLFKRGLDNKYVNMSFPVSILVSVLVIFAPPFQTVFLTSSFNGKYIGYVLCMLPISVLLPSPTSFLFPPLLLRTSN